MTTAARQMVARMVLGGALALGIYGLSTWLGANRRVAAAVGAGVGTLIASVVVRWWVRRG